MDSMCVCVYVFRIDKDCLAKAFINSCRTLLPSKIIPIVFLFLSLSLSLSNSVLQLLMMNNATVWIQSKWQQTNYYHERRGFFFYQRITCFTYFVLFQEGVEHRKNKNKKMSFFHISNVVSENNAKKFMLCNEKPKL